MTRIAFTRRTLGVFLIFCLLTAWAVTSLNAQLDMQSDDTLSIGGELGDMGFYAGGDIDVSATSSDDIFVAGGEITLTGVSADHLIVAGGQITATDVAVEDIIMAGGNLGLDSGTVSDDIVVFGGNIGLGEALSVGGSLVVSGGNISILNDIGGDAVVSGGNIDLQGNVGGDARLSAGNISIGPDVVIDGDLRWAADEFFIDPSATVTGEIIEEEYEGSSSGFSVEAIIAAFIGAFVFLIGLALIIIAIAALFPGLMNRSSQMIGDKPFTSLGIGFLVMVVLPLIAFVLMVSIIGLSAGISLMAIFLALIPFATAGITYFGGMKLRALAGHKDEPQIVARIVWTFAATMILLILGIIPFLGLLIWTIALWIGMGAIVTRGGAALADA